MTLQRFVPNFALICVGVMIGAIFIILARSAYIYDPVTVNNTTLFGIRVMEMAVLGSLLAIMPEVFPHVRASFQQLCRRSHPTFLSVPKVLFGVFVSGFMMMVALAFWRRAFDKLLVFIYPSVDPAPAGKITALLAFVMLYLCMWWIHAICRGVTDPSAKSWRVEHLKMAVIFIGSVLLTLFGV